MRDFQYIDFSGGLNYQETNSIIGSSGKKVYWLDSYNVRSYKDVGVTRVKGNFDILDGGFSDGILATGVGYSINSQFMCIASNTGDFYEVDVVGGSLSSSLTTGLSTTEKGNFVPLKNALLYSNSIDDLFYYSKDPDRITLITGTATINGTVNIIGAGTLFQSEFLVGDQIIINGETRIISEITSDTAMKVSIAFTTSASGQTITRTLISYLIAEKDIEGETVQLRSKAVEFFNNRIFIAKNDILSWSGLGVYNDWSSTGNEDSSGYYREFGSDITAIKSFKQYLLIFLANGNTYIMSGDFDQLQFSFAPFFDKTCLSPFGLLTANNQQYFYDDGVYTTDQVGELNQIRLGSEKSELINNDDKGFLNGDLDTSRLNEIFAIHNKFLREIWFYFPIINKTYLNTVYIYNYQRQQWYKRVQPQNVTSAVYYEDNVYSVTSAGEILKEEVRNTWNGGNIEFNFCTQFFNFGELNKTKDIDEMWLTLDTFIENDFYYNFKFNYDTKSGSPIIPLSIVNPDSGLWDVSNWDEKKFAIQIEQSSNSYIYNGNRSIQVCFLGTEENQNFALIGLEFRGVVANAI